MERNDDIRVWAYIIAIAMYFLFEFPVPTIITIIILFALYVIIRGLPSSNKGVLSGYRNFSSRRIALEAANMYLAPYSDIWRDLRLSNKNCSLRLGHDGITIVGQESSSAPNYRGRSFKIVKSKSHTMQEVWDMYCLNFDYLTNYDALVNLSCSFEVSIVENSTKTSTYTTLKTDNSKKFQKSSAKNNKQK